MCTNLYQILGLKNFFLICTLLYQISGLKPVGKENKAQEFMQTDKDERGAIVSRSLFGARYVPLVKGKR